MTTLNLTLEEIKRVGALTPLAHLFAKQGDLVRFQQCLRAGASLTSTDSGKTLTATVLETKDEALAAAIWAHSKQQVIKSKDVWEAVVNQKQENWFRIFLKEVVTNVTLNRVAKTKFRERLADWLSDDRVWAADAVFEVAKETVFPQNATHCLTEAIRNPKAAHWISRLSKHVYGSKPIREASETMALNVDHFKNSSGWTSREKMSSPITEAVKRSQWDIVDDLVKAGYPLRPSYLPYEECNEINLALRNDVSDEGVRFLLGRGFSPLIFKDEDYNYNPKLTAQKIESAFEKIKKDKMQELVSGGFVFPKWDLTLETAFELERFSLIKDLVGAGCSIERLHFMQKHSDEFSKEDQAIWERRLLMSRLSDTANLGHMLVTTL